MIHDVDEVRLRSKGSGTSMLCALGGREKEEAPNYISALEIVLEWAHSQIEGEQ